MINLTQRTLLAYLVLSYGIFFFAVAHSINSESLTICFALSMGSFLFLKNSFPVDDFQRQTGETRNLAIVCGLLFLALAHIFLIPPYVRDDLIYHLLTPKRILSDGGLWVDPYNINANFPMFFEMPLVLLESFKNWVSPFFINYFILIFLSLFYYAMARKQFAIRPEIALWGMVLMATTPKIYTLLHSCYVEIFLSLLILITFYHYVQYIRERKKSAYWYTAMLFAGILCATKYLGILYALFLIMVEFFCSKNRRVYYSGVLICFFTCMPWYAKNWIALGNPVYPFLNFLFTSPSISIERSFYYGNMFSEYHMGRSLSDYLLLPFRLLWGTETVRQPGQVGFDGKISFFYVFSLLSFINREKKYHAITALFFLYAVFWSLSSQQIRFLLPPLILASLVGLKIADKYWDRFRIPLRLFFVFILAQNSFNIYQHMQKDKIWPLVVGNISREMFLEHHLPISYGVANRLKSKLDSKRDKLFTVGTFGRNYYFDLPVVTNTYYETEILTRAFKKEKLQVQILDNFIKEQGITHILFNGAYFQDFHGRDPEMDGKALNDYLMGKKVIFQERAVTVFQCKP